MFDGKDMQNTETDLCISLSCAQVIGQITEKISHIKAAPLQLPIGLEDHFSGIVDLIKMKAYYYEGGSGYAIFLGSLSFAAKEEK